MALGFFKKNAENTLAKNHLDIPENKYDAPFDVIIASMDPEFLEDAVASHFDDLLPYRTANELRYFRLYSSWHKLFIQNFHEVLNHFATNGDYMDFVEIIKLFPEYAPEVYEFLLNEYTSKDLLSSTVGDKLNVTDDVLIPMADIEKYQSEVYHHHFDIVRKDAIDILDSADNYAEIWDILQVFEQYFDMPREMFSDFLHEIFEEEIAGTFEKKSFTPTYQDEESRFDFEECDILNDMFMDLEAYEYIMDRLPTIMHRGGIGVYEIFVILLGKNLEVEKAHDFCHEFITDEQFPTLVGDTVIIKGYVNNDKEHPQIFTGKIRKVNHRGVIVVRTAAEEASLKKN
ncbi:MAG: hypothetical protein IJ220_03865 [Clostridia bacterium]|nr:hypothetical protein [Clostridia bacterium]